jgi:DNA-binding CsgD family transcriptional regulator
MRELRAPRRAEETLLGRAAELAELDALIDSAAAGEGRAMLLEGPAGIGKTELVEAARERAQDAGLRVLAAGASELESAYPYGVARQWLEREWALAGVEGAGDAAELVLSRAPARALPGEDATFGILHALYLFASELSLERPLLLALDDAQWADLESLRFLAYMVRRLGDLPVGVVVAARVGETGPAAEPLERVRAESAVQARAVAPLAETDCAALLQRAFGAEVGPEFGRACLRATGGNPLYLVELQRALAREGVDGGDESALRVDEVTPAALSRYVLRRLAEVSPEAPRLAGAMSVLGDGGAVRHAARLAGLEPRQAGAVARSLVGAAILRDDDPVRFVHPLVRRVIAEGLTSVEREDWHLEAARLLLEERSSPDRVAGHLLHARPGGRGWCVEALRAAARQAMSRSAPEAAVEYLRRAISEPPERGLHVTVLGELGAAEALAHDPRAIDHLEQARSGSEDPIQRTDLALRLAAAHLDLFESIEACHVIERALAELDPNDDLTRTYLEANLASVAWLEAETVPSGVQVLGKYWDDPPDGPAGRSILAQKALVMYLTAHPVTDVRATAAAALRDPGEDDLRATFETALSVLVFTEGYDLAATLIERIAGLRSGRLVRRRLASLETIRGFLALRLGALGDAELHLREGLRLTPPASSPAGWLVVRGLLASVLTEQGSLDDAERMLDALPEEPWPAHVATGFALAARCSLRREQGRMAEALADLEQLSRLSSTFSATVPAVHLSVVDAAVVLPALGLRAHALSLIDDELERAHAFGASVALGHTLRAAGIVRGDSRGLELLREAVAVLDTTPAELERAHAHVDLGAALRRANQRRLAREELDTGLRLAQRCGAGALARRAYDELQASGLRLRSAELEDRDALTPAEKRIARHAADGMTNREIAGALYLSIKTVEMHLGRVYRKLGISSRAELAGALQQGP